MAGRVVAILTQQEDAVIAGQDIIAPEAMKVENEIRAEHDGTLQRVFVQAGQAVDTGKTLFELG